MDTDTYSIQKKTEKHLKSKHSTDGTNRKQIVR